jgi:anti-sigma factor RsiW
VTGTHMTGSHMSRAQVDAYVDGSIAADQEWAVEAHLESCAACRALLAERAGPATAALVDDVWTGLLPQLAVPTPAPLPRRALPAWVAPSTGPWVAVLVGVLALGAALQMLVGGAMVPVLFLPVTAPVLALAGVASAWGHGADPLHDLVAATPRAGSVLLRRLAVVLAVLVAALAAAAWFVGASAATTVVPAVACALVAVAVGGARWARAVAIGIGGLWIVGVAGPVVVLAVMRAVEPPVLLRPELLPAWLAVLGAAAVVAALRGLPGRAGAR